MTFFLHLSVLISPRVMNILTFYPHDKQPNSLLLPFLLFSVSFYLVFMTLLHCNYVTVILGAINPNWLMGAKQPSNTLEVILHMPTSNLQKLAKKRTLDRPISSVVCLSMYCLLWNTMAWFQLNWGTPRYYCNSLLLSHKMLFILGCFFHSFVALYLPTTLQQP